jgi:hypothetical protein
MRKTKDDTGQKQPKEATQTTRREGYTTSELKMKDACKTHL